MQTVKDQDLELMDEVSNLVQKKAQMMARLKALLDEALSDTHKNSDGSFKEEFQQEYGSKVAEVCDGARPGGTPCGCECGRTWYFATFPLMRDPLFAEGHATAHQPRSTVAQSGLSQDGCHVATTYQKIYAAWCVVARDFPVEAAMRRVLEPSCTWQSSVWT